MQPTGIRFVTAGLLTIVACLLYLDRFALGIASETMRTDLNLTQTQMSWVQGSFFLSYALLQVPAGWLSDRFGSRLMLTIFIIGWSLFTGLLGVTSLIWLLLLWRLLCGATQAGAYPIATGMIREWFPVGQRGVASSVVAMGGRAGAVIAPLLTAWLMSSLHGRWQTVLILYGGSGILIAVVFYWICRDTPSQHPSCNEAERLVIRPVSSIMPAPSSEVVSFPAQAILTNVGLWGNSATQLLTNVGWIFVVTWLPRYLESMHGIPIKKQALMTAIPTAAGIVGMMAGGWVTDLAARQFGLKWGRRIPVLVTRFTAAAGYAGCFLLSQMQNPETRSWLPWGIIACLSFSTFSCDLGVPAIWAYAQDVGGKFTASIMGWGNMWGNVGATMAPPLYNAVLGETPGLTEWNRLFAVCCGVFAVAGISALALDSTHAISTADH